MTAPASSTALVAVRDRREAVIQRLSDGFATDLIDVDEFETRLSSAHAAQSIAALDALLVGLAPLPSDATTTALAPLSVHGELTVPRENIRATFGNVERHGAWSVPSALSARATFGNVVLDFREARFTAGVTELDARAAFGNLEIIVPPQLAVDCQGGSLFGNIETHGVDGGVPDPERPFLRVRGRAVFGNIEVHARLPGETAPAARKRLGPAGG